MLMSVTWVARPQKPLTQCHQRTRPLLPVPADHQCKVVDHRYKVVDHRYKPVDHIHPLLVHHHHTTEAHPIKARVSLRQRVDGKCSRRKRPHTNPHRPVNLSPNMPSLKPVTGTRRPTVGRCTIFVENYLVTYSLSRAKGLLSSHVRQHKMTGGRVQLTERQEYSQQIMSHYNINTIRLNINIYCLYCILYLYISTAERITVWLNLSWRNYWD